MLLSLEGNETKQKHKTISITAADMLPQGFRRFKNDQPLSDL